MQYVHLMLDVPSTFYRQLLDVIDAGVYCVDPDGRIFFWNNKAEAITGYAAADVLGSRCKDNILVHIDADGRQLCTSSCPIANTLLDGQSRECAVFLHHRDGHRVPVTVRTNRIIDSVGRVIGAVETFNDDSVTGPMLQQIDALRQLAFIDPLTGIANRRYLETSFEARLEEVRRYGWPFGLVMLDIDDFKRVNDTYGHPIGDRVLQTVARTLANASRPFDVVGRFGGEEFVVLLVGVDDEQLFIFAERMRVLIEHSFIHVQKEHVSVTASLGATLARTEDTAESLLARADALLYRSKADGKNRVTVESFVTA